MKVCLQETRVFAESEFHTLFGYERRDLERAWASRALEPIGTVGWAMFGDAVGQVLGYPGAIGHVPRDVGERLPMLFDRLRLLMANPR